MRIYFYCPDRHIVYSGDTPDRTGVGGGITARLRTAAALAALGHEVTLACNCPRAERYAGVDYVPVETVRSIQVDVLVMHSSGGQLDMRGVCALAVQARLRVLAVEGANPIHGADEVRPDYLYACSNFIADAVENSWKPPRTEMFVSHHGVKRLSRRAFLSRFQKRDPHELIYSSHPSKGLAAALAITRKLRLKNPRFHLEIYGGAALWGEYEAPSADETGIRDHGLVGQDRLLRAYARAGFALHLQQREEPFGIALAESMAAGCLVIASPVGAYSEIVEHGRTGVLIPGDSSTDEVQGAAAAAIADLARDRPRAEAMREHAAAYPLDWSTVAQTWASHWRWVLDGKPGFEPAPCQLCGMSAMALADGLHCLHCKRYSRPGNRSSGL